MRRAKMDRKSKSICSSAGGKVPPAAAGSTRRRPTPSPPRDAPSLSSSLLSVPPPSGKQQRAHSQPNIREGLANLNEQLCATMFGVVLGAKQQEGTGAASASSSAAARASSASPSVVSSSVIWENEWRGKLFLGGLKSQGMGVQKVVVAGGSQPTFLRHLSLPPLLPFALTTSRRGRK